MLRRTLLPLALTAGLALAAAMAPAQAQEQRVNLYNWTDYISEDVIKKFEAETGIKVFLDTFDTNETLLAKLKAGGSYDVVFPSADYVEVLLQEKLIQKIDTGSMANFAGLDPAFKGPQWDPNNEYVAPWHYGVTSFTVNTKVITEPVDSLKTLFEPPAAAMGKVGMFSSASEVVALAAVYLGIEQCTSNPANLKKIQDLLMAQKPAVKVYNSDAIIERQTSEETVIHQQWNGASFRTRRGNPAVQFIYPKEGVVVWQDTMAVPTSAQNVENAKTFINFMLRPDIAAMRANFVGYGTAVQGMTGLDPEIANAPEFNTPTGVNLVPKPGCSAEAIRAHDQIFTRIRS